MILMIIMIAVILTVKQILELMTRLNFQMNNIIYVFPFITGFILTAF